MRDCKSIPQFTKGIEGRTVTGLFAIYGNVDSGLDRSHLGAFSKTFAEQKTFSKLCDKCGSRKLEHSAFRRQTSGGHWKELREAEEGSEH